MANILKSEIYDKKYWGEGVGVVVKLMVYCMRILPIKI